MPVSRMTPVNDEAKSKSMAKLLPLELYAAVDVVDAAGKKATHIVFRAKGTKQFFRLLPAGAEATMKPLAGWLLDLIEKELGAASSSGEAVPPDMGTNLPTGI